MSLKNGDLRGVIKPYISIDEFEPKSGTTQEVIVVGFYATDQAPANDLNTFIQRGSIDVLDADVSPSPDEEGNYLIFVEFDRDDLFPETFMKMVKDVENLTNEQEWQVKPYLADNAMHLDDPKLFNRLILNPDAYQTKAEFNPEELDVEADEDVVEALLRNSDLSNLMFTEGYAVFNDKLAAKILATGDVNKYISESAITLDDKLEVTTLASMLGENWNVFDMTDKVAIENTAGDIVLLHDLQLVYGMPKR